MSDMNNITIANLFSSKDKPPQFGGKLDVESLFNQEKKTSNFDSKILLEGLNEKRRKLQACYRENYIKCCDTITDANKSGLTKIKYGIPSYSECIGYTCKECIEYIKKHLEEQSINVKIINDTKMIISWEDLETKLKRSI
jgi:hypothetical protein